MLYDYESSIAFVFNIGEKGIGKTPLLNDILDFNGRIFQTGAKGIKIWSKPIFKENE